MLGILNIGYLELLLIVGAAVMLFGGDLPDTARKAGRMLSKLRDTASDLGRAFRDEAEPPPELLPPRLPSGHTEPPPEVLEDPPPEDTGEPSPPVDPVDPQDPSPN